jgi:phospholipid/cholesterol/gamma-HCH transport system permease protein
MNQSTLKITNLSENLTLSFSGELTLYGIQKHQKEFDSLSILSKYATLDLSNLEFIDTAAAIFINKLQERLTQVNITTTLLTEDEKIINTLKLAKKYLKDDEELPQTQTVNSIEYIGKIFYGYYISGLSFIEFLGRLFVIFIYYTKNIKNIRIPEISYEINESAIKALGIVSLTSFLIGVVVAYQSAYQLKIYGANIFIVDMLGISILRELAPLITAIVIAGRSGSAFTAQIGAMKITQELDAMQTMGFDPYLFLVMPRIIALMIAMPILIFVSDIMGVFGGMLIANLDLGITTELFLNRFNEVIAAKHFFIGITKGPFFAFLIASIGIYRGLKVKDDTQSIGLNTTKSVVESIFAVIVCDAIFSVVFTSIGI